MLEEKKFEEYAVLDAQIKELTKKKDELKIEIVDELAVSEDQTAEKSVGKFTISNLKTWTYTPKVTALQEQFKAQKATEESTGEATFTEKPSLRFTPIKL